MEQGNTRTATYPPIESLVNGDFNLQFINDTKEVVRNDIRAEHETIFSPVLNKSLDVTNISVAPVENVDPTLQK